MGKKLLNRKAFTLMEVLIALAIVVVLMAISIPMVSGISNKLKMKELDNYAKTIYLEAQNLLLEKKVEGSLLSFYEELQDSYAGRNLLSAPQDYEGDGWGSLYYLSTNDPLTKEIIPVGTSFDGNFIIELNPMTGDVYGVFYREGSEGLDYVSDIKTLSGRSSAERKAAGLGYYGGGSVDTEEVVQEYITLDQKVSVVNEEELYVIISYKFSSVLSRDFLSDEFVIQMKIKGVESGAEAELIVEKDNYSVNGNRMEVYVLLDSLLPGGSFNDIVTEDLITNGEEFLLGENIEIKVKATFNNGAYFQSDNATATTNNLFTGKSATGETIYISNLRHLMHLDGAYYEHKGSAPVVTMLKDIDFATEDFTWKTGGVGGPKFIYQPGSGRPASLTTFVPLKNASVFEKDGAEFIGKKLTNFIIDESNLPFAEGETTYVGIVQKISGMRVSDVQMVDTIVNGGLASNVGAFAGKISDSEVTNCGVYLTTRNAQKSYYADMDPATAENAELYVNRMDQRYDKYKVSGSTFVGGFCGSAEDTQFDKCFTAVKVSGSSNTGGFCGVATGNSTFANCYTSGEIKATERVGGFVGNSDNSVYYNCYSTADIFASNAAGGFVGTSENSTYRSCVSYAKLTTGPEGLSVPANSGVFYRGKVVEDTNEFEDCKYLNQIGYNAGLMDATDIEACAYGELKQDPKNSKETSYPYSLELVETAFPFKLVTGQHYGNWQIQFTIDTSLVYYEVYPVKDENGENRYDEDGELICEYGYYCVTTVSDEEGEEKEDFTWVLNTLQDKICIEDGYALFTTYYLESFDCLLYVGSKGSPDELSILVYEPDKGEGPTTQAGKFAAELKRQQTALEFKGYEGKYSAETDFNKLDAADTFLVSGMYLYQLPYELQATDRYNVENFYDKLVVYNGMPEGSTELRETEGIETPPVIGLKEYNPDVPTTGLTYYYCSHFAKNAINPGILDGMILNSDIWAEQGAIRNPKTVYVRSAKQLNALGRYSYYWNTNGGNGYKDEELSEETGEYVKAKINFVQETDISFSEYVKTYCGQEFDLMETGEEYSNQVIGKTFSTTEKQFNNNYNGSGKKIIDFRVESTQRFVGLFGEIQDSTIENVIMTVSQPGAGYIRSRYNGDGQGLSNWGWIILGILNLFMDIDYFNGETASVGGLVGISYLTNNTIQNCSVSGYEVRYIGGTSPDVASIAIGGLVGTSMSPVKNCAATNDVRVDIRGEYRNSIAVGGLIGSTFYSSTTDSYSGGTIDISLSGEARVNQISALGIGGISGGVLKLWNNAKAADVSDTTFSNVYSYTRIYVDKDDFKNVGNNFSLSAWFSGQARDLYIAPIAVKKVLFNPYTSTGTYGVKVSDGDIKIDSASCVYLDYSSEGMELYFEENIFNYNHLSGGNAKSYEELKEFSFTGSEMKTVDADHSFPVSEGLQGSKYPFKSAVTVAEEIDPELPPEVEPVHYGDWPKALIGGVKLASEYLVYYENYDATDGNTFGYYYIDEKGSVQSTLRNDVFVVDDAGYVLLKNKKEGAILDIEILLGEEEKVTYYVHGVSDSTITPGSSDSSKAYTWSYTNIRIIDGVAYESNSESKTLYVNSNFAAAIGTDNTLGTTQGNPFQIRNARQFCNINGKTYAKDIYFSQTTAIDMRYMADSDSKKAPVTIINPTKKSGWSTVDAGDWIYDGGNHKIIGANEALFEENDGIIKNVHSVGSTSIFINTNDAGSITNCVVEGANAGTNALFVSDNNGTIENCYVTNSVLSASSKTMAGFAHTNDGTIRSCYVGQESVPVTITANGSSAAGFVYINNGTVETCHVTSATITANNSSAAGFAYTNNKTITGCEVYALGQMSKVSINGSEACGFVYTNNNNGSIQRCGVYATKNNDAYHNVSIVGESSKASGFVMSNAKTISECFIVGYVSGKNGVFGFTETNGQTGNISKCYVNAELVSSASQAFGFVRENDGSISYSYFTGWLKSKNGAYGFGTNTADSSANMRYCYSIFEYSKMDNTGSVDVYGFAEPEEPKTNHWFWGEQDNDDSEVTECYFGLANTVTVKGDGRGGQAALGDMRIEQHGELKQGTTPSQPFNDALGTDYPYPEIQSLGHRGDWFVP